MRKKNTLQAVQASLLVALLLIAVVGCTFPQAGAGEVVHDPEDSSSVYGDWESSSRHAEEQLLRASEIDSPDATIGSEVENPPRESHFRDTTGGEPLAIHQFINELSIDDEFVRVTLHAKTADALGDAGFTLFVENKYAPLTSAGFNNYCYITPIMGTWTVNGVKMDPLTEGRVFPGDPGTIYLYFDELSNIEQLVEVRGQFEVFLISDWWNPVGVYEFNQA